MTYFSLALNFIRKLLSFLSWSILSNCLWIAVTEIIVKASSNILNSIWFLKEKRKEGRQKRKPGAILFKSQVNLFSACICKSSVGNNTLGIALEFKVYWKDLINLSLVKMLAAVFLHHHFWNVSRYQWMWTSFTYRWIDNPTKKD